MNQDTQDFIEDLEEENLTQSKFIAEVYEIAWQCNPNLDQFSSFQDVLKELRAMKDRSMRWEIIVSSFKPEPELFPIRPTLKETQARRQGEL